MVPTITVPAKYKSVDELSAMSAQARKAGRVVVFTISFIAGTFIYCVRRRRWETY